MYLVHSRYVYSIIAQYLYSKKIRKKVVSLHRIFARILTKLKNGDIIAVITAYDVFRRHLHAKKILYNFQKRRQLMKKFLSLIMVAAMLVAVFAMVGCDKPEETTTADTTTPAETTTTEEPEEGGFNWLILILILAILAIIAGVVAYLIHNKKKNA